MCPIYELYCSKCRKTEEDLMPYDRFKNEEFYCSKCDNILIKNISSGGFILKGAGFYKPSRGE